MITGSAIPGYFLRPGKNSHPLKQLPGPEKGALIPVSATPRIFSRTGKNSLPFKQLPGPGKYPWGGLHYH
ncbi:MAG: hypothetical protein ACOC3W_09035 [Thermodesulfobacteriota bacterium]